MSAHQRNVLVGAVVLVGLGMLAWMTLQFANKAANYFLSSGTRITLTAPRAEGVGDGSPVTYKGVNVGRVTGVRRVPSARSSDGEQIVIDALIQAKPPLPGNLRGRIKQTSLLGASATIALEPDPAAATQPSLAGGRKGLNPDEPIPADFVPDISSLGDNVRDLTGSMQETIRAMNDIIGDPQVKADIKASLGSARTTLENANRVSERLEKLSASLEKTAEEASGTMTDVRGTVKEARADIGKLSENLSQRMQQVAESLQHVQSVAQKIDNGKGTAGQLVNDPKLYQSLADTAAEMNLMVKDMRRLIQQWEQEGIIKL